MTVKELAAQYGISEQAIRQRCATLGITIETTRQGKRADLSAQSEAAIKALYQNRLVEDAGQIEISKLKAQLKDAQKKIEQLTIKNLDLAEIAAKAENEVKRMQEELNTQKQVAELQAMIAHERQLSLDREHETVTLLTARLPATTQRRSVRQWLHDTFLKTEQKP